MGNVLRSGPFTSVNKDRGYENRFFTDYFASFLSNGVFPNPSIGLQVMADSGLNLIVNKGKGWIDGHIHLGDEDKSLVLAAADTLLDRIDKVVLRMNTIDRTITKEIKKGKAATKPIAPMLQRDEDVWELGLADIYIKKGTVSILQKDITDLRLDKEQCGIVKGTIEEIDTTTLFNQYQSWITEKKLQYDNDLIDYTEDKKIEWDQWFNLTSTDLEEGFNIWFDTIRDVLTEDAAGNLLLLIQDIPKVYTGAAEPVGMKPGDLWHREIG